MKALSGKKARIKLKPNFHLEGTIVVANEIGIVFQTLTETSFLNYDVIADIKITGDGDAE